MEPKGYGAQEIPELLDKELLWGGVQEGIQGSHRGVSASHPSGPAFCLPTWDQPESKSSGKESHVAVNNKVPA